MKTPERLEGLPVNIPLCLRGVRYPAWKRDILVGARLNRAPQHVMRVLRHIPEAEYQGLEEVLKNYKQLICSTSFAALQN